MDLVQQTRWSALQTVVVSHQHACMANISKISRHIYMMKRKRKLETFFITQLIYFSAQWPGVAPVILRNWRVMSVCVFAFLSHTWLVSCHLAMPYLITARVSNLSSIGRKPLVLSIDMGGNKFASKVTLLSVSNIHLIRWATCTEQVGKSEVCRWHIACPGIKGASMGRAENDEEEDDMEVYWSSIGMWCCGGCPEALCASASNILMLGK